jgi:DNA-repair protein complementing XP-A cells
VEEFAFEKWGGSEGLDKEWERREGEKKERKDKEFRRRTMEARKRTRTSLWQSRQQELQQSQQQHQHQFAPVGDAAGGEDDGEQTRKQKCLICGISLEIEEF